MGMYACLPGKEEEGPQDPLGWNERELCPPIHWTRKGPLLPEHQILASCEPCTKGLVRNSTTAAWCNGKAWSRGWGLLF